MTMKELRTKLRGLRQRGMKPGLSVVLYDEQTGKRRRLRGYIVDIQKNQLILHAVKPPVSKARRRRA